MRHDTKITIKTYKPILPHLIAFSAAWFLNFNTEDHALLCLQGKMKPCFASRCFATSGPFFLPCAFLPMHGESLLAKHPCRTKTNPINYWFFALGVKNYKV